MIDLSYYCPYSIHLSLVWKVTMRAINVTNRLPQTLRRNVTNRLPQTLRRNVTTLNHNVPTQNPKP
jgi:hypothetical protein